MKFAIAGDTEGGGKAAVTIDVQGRTHPDARLPCDREWVRTRVKVVLPGYRVFFDGDMRTCELPPFLSDLKRMNESLRGSAELTTLEEFLELRGKMDELGHIEWSGRIRYPVGIGATLTFEFRGDQSYLPELISELEGLCKAFPAIEY